jgi:hypothetical protein
MRVDQTRQKRLLAEIDDLPGIARFDLVKFSDSGDSIA